MLETWESEREKPITVRSFRQRKREIIFSDRSFLHRLNRHCMIYMNHSLLMYYVPIMVCWYIPEFVSIVKLFQLTDYYSEVRHTRFASYATVSITFPTDNFRLVTTSVISFLTTTWNHCYSIYQRPKMASTKQMAIWLVEFGVFVNFSTKCEVNSKKMSEEVLIALDYSIVWFMNVCISTKFIVWITYVFFVSLSVLGPPVLSRKTHTKQQTVGWREAKALSESSNAIQSNGWTNTAYALENVHVL